MRNSLITLFIISFVGLCKAQSLVVCDIDTKKPLSYVSVYSKDNGTYTNNIGKVNLLKDFSYIDTLTFKTLGYSTLVKPFNDLKKRDTLYLKSTVEQLSEVVINQKKERIVLDKSRGVGLMGHYNRARLGPSREIVSFIYPKEVIKNTIISNITLIFNNNGGYRHMKEKIGKNYILFRLNIYNQESDSLSKIYRSKPFKVNSLDKQEVKVDIDEYIVLDEIAIGVEYIGYYDQNGNHLDEQPFSRGPGLTSKSNKAYDIKTFVKFMQQNKKDKFKSIEKDLFLDKNEKRNLRFEMELIKI